MSNLRFRAFDKMRGKYIYPSEFNKYKYAITLGGEFFNAENRAVKGDEYIVEQSTGMFDRNGVEIFEGDMCRYEPPNCSAYKRMLGEIMRIENDLEFCNNKVEWLLFPDFCAESLTVIPPAERVRPDNSQAHDAQRKARETIRGSIEAIELSKNSKLHFGEQT